MGVALISPSFHALMLSIGTRLHADGKIKDFMKLIHIAHALEQDLLIFVYHNS